jgi:hypothetical protein
MDRGLVAAPGQMLAANGLVYFGGDDGNVYAYRQSSAAGRNGYIGRGPARWVRPSPTRNTSTSRSSTTARARSTPATVRCGGRIELPARPTLGMALGRTSSWCRCSRVNSPSARSGPEDCGQPQRIIAFPKPPDAPPGFFQRLESSVIKQDLSKVYLATVSFQDERTLTALDGAAAVKK